MIRGKTQSFRNNIKCSFQLAFLGNVNVAEQWYSAYRRSISVHNEKVLQIRCILNVIIIVYVPVVRNE